ETSLTVPGIRYVVDAGLARISRYSHRLKVQRLPIEPVSQASADQRAGRCGRVAPGICIRLYREDDYDARPEFTDPEILRTNLASVILQMTNLGLGDVEAFPFLDPPDLRAIRDGVALLEELGALELDRPADRRRLTRLGRKLVNLPVDPRMARMVVQADREGSVHEVLVIAAALSIQDPRERPTEHRQEADELHRRFDVTGSDFLALVRLWDHLAERQRELSSNRFRKLCRAEHLNYLRVREWQDLHRQLRQAAKRAGIVASTAAATPDQVHRALLAGLLSHLGMRDKDGREYQGARGARFALVPSSRLARKPPAWVMAAELVETNRLWGRMAASVQPEWAEDLAGHLVKRSYGEPRWDERSGRAVASERVTLYGLPVVANRTVGLGAVDSELARELFIEHALVRGEWSTRHRFRADNARCIEEVRELGDKLRRWDLADHDAVFAFYDRVLGSDVVSGRHFDTWWKQVRRTEPDLLTMTAADLVGDDAGTDADAFPDEWRQGDLVLPVSYRFEPGEVGDGVIVHIPLAVLNRVDAHGFDWQVPGFREELVAAILRTLPKRLRRSLTPLADAAHELARSLVVVDRPLVDVVAEAVGARLGERVSAADVDLREVPSHLRVTFAIEDGDEVMAIGKDLEAVRDLVGGRVRAAIADAAPDIERSGIERWDFGDLPTVVETTVHGHVVRGYPALLDDGDSVSIKVFSTPEIQARIMATGVRRLLLRSVPVGVKGLAKGVPNEVALAVGAVPGLSLGGLLRDAITAAADRVIAAHGGPPWDRAGFEALLEAARAALDARPDHELVKERVWVLGKLSHSHLLDPDPTEGLALTAAAVELAERLEDPADRWVGLGWRGVSLFGLGRHAEWEDLGQRCADLAAGLPVVFQRDSLSWLAQAAFERGDVRGALELVDRYVTLLEPLGLALPSFVFGVPAVVAAFEGRFDDAHPLFDAWLDASNLPDVSRVGVLSGEGWAFLWTAEALRYEAALDAFPASADALLSVYPLRATVVLLGGDESRAESLYDDWLALLEFAPARFVAHVAAIATYATWRLDRPAVARRLLDVLAPHAGRWPTFGMPIFAGPADLHLGVNHVTAGDLDAAEASLRSALASCEEVGFHAWATWTRFHLADALARQGREDEAARLAATARADAERMGMRLITQDLDRLGLT
ncbi:MAG: ATP-dependent RNA helicase HrpA, partial [Acidimicrobiales bacterium]|nr:ATP-dependent RNA helicase HrpA [Acidimicrobiales bacterium]